MPPTLLRHLERLLLLFHPSLAPCMELALLLPLVEVSDSLESRAAAPCFDENKLLVVVFAALC